MIIIPPGIFYKYNINVSILCKKHKKITYIKLNVHRHLQRENKKTGMIYANIY